MTLSPQKKGAGNAGCLLHPRSRVPRCTQKCAHEHTGTVGAIRHSLRKGAYGGKNPSQINDVLLLCSPLCPDPLLIGLR